MIYHRRNFIKTAATGIALTALTGKLSGCDFSTGDNNKNESLKEFGLQLYTLRDDMPKDPKGILKQVASMGYKQVESFEDDALGMFWGMKNTEFKKYLDDIGLVIVSSHCDIDKNFEQKRMRLQLSE